ncbi:hypothetical protein KM043_010197 [Ampulex compressa]|nr:hypothetical protein KM043_010197 [Ampulex compressa]
MEEPSTGRSLRQITPKSQGIATGEFYTADFEFTGLASTCIGCSNVIGSLLHECQKAARRPVGYGSPSEASAPAVRAAPDLFMAATVSTRMAVTSSIGNSDTLNPLACLQLAAVTVHLDRELSVTNVLESRITNWPGGFLPITTSRNLWVRKVDPVQEPQESDFPSTFQCPALTGRGRTVCQHVRALSDKGETKERDASSRCSPGQSPEGQTAPSGYSFLVYLRGRLAVHSSGQCRARREKRLLGGFARVTCGGLRMPEGNQPTVTVTYVGGDNPPTGPLVPLPLPAVPDTEAG